MTTPWSDAYIANVKGPVRTAAKVILERGSSVAPQAFCCGSNTISDTKAPSAVMNVTPTEGYTDTIFNFDGSDSYAPGGTIVLYTWDFGDGYGATGVTATHKYAQEGNYEATLTVENVLGEQGQCAKIIVVKNPSLPILPNTAGNRLWTGGTGRAWYTLAFGIDDATTPPWIEKSTGLPAGARVYEVQVDPQSPSRVYAACGHPTHAVAGGLRKRTAWGSEDWVDCAPAKPAQWRDPEWMGTEATRSSATLIALTDDEWSKAIWRFVRPSHRFDKAVLAVCQVKKTGADAYGTFACYYRSSESWDVEQLWLNDTKPWWCKPIGLDVCLSESRYVYLVLEGQDPAGNDYKIAYNVDYGQEGAWFTTQLTVSGVDYKPSGAVWAIHDWQTAEDPGDPESDWTFSDTQRVQVAVTTSPWVVEGEVRFGTTAPLEYDVAETDGWGLRSVDALAMVAQWITPASDIYVGAIRLKMKRVVAAGQEIGGNVWVEVQTDDGNFPSGTAVATSLNVAPDAIDEAYEWVTFSFTEPFLLLASTNYHIVLRGDYSFSASNHVVWAASNAAGYGGGSPSTYDRDQRDWTARPGYDNMFKLHDPMMRWVSAEVAQEVITEMCGCSGEVLMSPPARGWWAWKQTIGGDIYDAARWLQFAGPDGRILHYGAPGTPATFLTFHGPSTGYDGSACVCHGGRTWPEAWAQGSVCNGYWVMPDACGGIGTRGECPDYWQVNIAAFLPALHYEWIASDALPAYMGGLQGINIDYPCSVAEKMLHRDWVIAAFSSGPIRLGKRTILSNAYYVSEHFALKYIQCGDVPFTVLDLDAYENLDLSPSACKTAAEVKALYPCGILSPDAGGHGFIFERKESERLTITDKTGSLPETIHSIGINHYEA